MEIFDGVLSPGTLLAAVAVTLFAGFVKGTMGFAMPLIMISIFGSFMSPTMALAGLILPTLITNIQQAFREGWRAARDTVIAYRRFIAMTVIFIALSAQLVPVIPGALMLGLLGVPVTVLALVQLAGVSMALPLRRRAGAEYGLGVASGFFGGIAGVWGPPLLVYLLSVGAAKRDMVRVQGVVFLIGGMVLTGAHMVSGVLRGPGLAFSALMVLPAIIGMIVGFRLQDKLDQDRFRRWTLVLLAITGLNLVRRALTGG
ncbi:MAG: sulfite exporter TauE/SafE family protein [Rhodobacteraceae bacterium]|nr:sulfite exporter TauE/SafE family protein [Paracoccaceae bacterium]